jgi:hypothetical protein
MPHNLPGTLAEVQSNLLFNFDAAIEQYGLDPTLDYSIATQSAGEPSMSIPAPTQTLQAPLASSSPEGPEGALSSHSSGSSSEWQLLSTYDHEIGPDQCFARNSINGGPDEAATAIPEGQLQPEIVSASSTAIPPSIPESNLMLRPWSAEEGPIWIHSSGPPSATSYKSIHEEGIFVNTTQNFD